MFNKFLFKLLLKIIVDKFYFLKYREFLPRGSGILTRRPLILQLVHGTEGETQFILQFIAKSIFFSDFFFQNF